MQNRKLSRFVKGVAEEQKSRKYRASLWKTLSTLFSEYFVTCSQSSVGQWVALVWSAHRRRQRIAIGWLAVRACALTLAGVALVLANCVLPDSKRHYFLADSHCSRSSWLIITGVDAHHWVAMVTEITKHSIFSSRNRDKLVIIIIQFQNQLINFSSSKTLKRQPHLKRTRFPGHEMTIS